MSKKPTYEELQKQVESLKEAQDELKKVEAALRDSEERYRKTFESITDSITITRIEDEQFIYVNDGFCHQTGYAREEVLGKTPLDISLYANPNERARFIEILEEHGKAEDVVASFRRKSGGIYYSEFSAKPISYAGEACLLTQSRDITNRKLAEAALRESEEKFRDLFDNAPLGYLEYDREGRITRVNQTNLDMLGYKREEMEGEFIWDLYVEKSEAREQIMAKLAGKLPPGRGFIRTYRRKDGSNLPVLVEDRLLRDDRKQIAGIRCTFQDITERKRAEEALRESEKRLRTAGKAAYDLIYEWNVGNDSLEWFGDIDGLLGYAPGTISRDIDAWLQLIHAEDRGKLENAVKLHRTAKEPIHYDYRIKHKDGSYRQILDRGLPMLNKQGRPYKWLGVCMDITERKQAEEKLLIFKESLENSTDAIGMSTPQGRHDFQNTAFSELFGEIGEYPPDSVYVDKNIGEEVFGTIMAGRQWTGEVKLFSKEGQERDILLRAYPNKDMNGNITTLVGIHTDITEQKKLEAQLQQAQKMEAIGALAGGIAHDFNNLLMAIQGRTSIMLMDKDASHPDFEHLRGIEDYVANATDLTKQLLGFARGGKYEVKPTDLNALVNEEIRMFGRAKKEISIREKYEQNLWSVEIDRGQIQQVLLNLSVNAWQAMPGGGNLYVETENVTLDENYVKPFFFKPGRYVKISITDTGFGMDKAIQEKIFDPFFTTKGMGRGTGLGLASVYGIVKNHGGFIDVYSEKGHGSTFKIYLPASQKEIIEEKKPVCDTIRGVETALFVDDEDMITETAENLLELLGYNVLTAGSGKEAIRIYKENKDRIDVVILDMIMPDMSGGETYDRINDINPMVKVLLSSGYSINGQATEILDRGCNGFIQKPFRINELSQKLREILDEE